MKVGARVQSYLHELREPQHSEDVEEEQARAQVLRVEIWQQRGACSVVRGAAWGCSLAAWGCSMQAERRGEGHLVDPLVALVRPVGRNA